MRIFELTHEHGQTVSLRCR